MRGFHDRYFEELTRAVAEVEATTSAEIVVAVEPYSGNYRDVDFAFGAAVAFAALALLFFTPWNYSELLSLADVAICFAAAAWISSAAPAVRRFLTRPQRRQAQARLGAAAAFYEESVWRARHGMGLLIYVSLLEREIIVLAGPGVARSVDTRAWNKCLQDLRLLGESPHPTQALLEGLKELGQMLSTALPAAADHPGVLPDTTTAGGHERIRSHHLQEENPCSTEE